MTNRGTGGSLGAAVTDRHCDAIVDAQEAGNVLRPRRAVIVNAFPDDNRGGAAITLATVRVTRQAMGDGRVSLVAVRRAPLRKAFRHTLAHEDIELLQPLVPVLALPGGGALAVVISLVLLLAPRAARGPTARRLQEADIVVSKGGHYFVERRTYSGLLSLWLTVYPLLYAWRCGRPTVVSGASIGPFITKASRILNGFVLRRMSVVMARDRNSYEAAIALGVERNRVKLVPDSAFLLEPPPPDHTKQVLGRIGCVGGKFGVVVLRDHVECDRLGFYEGVESLVRELLERGTVDRILVVVQVGTSEPSDRVRSDRFVRAIGDERVSLIDDDLGVHDIMALYRGASFVFTCRLHSALFATIVGCPAFPAAVLDKVPNLFQTLGLEAHVLPFPEPPSAATADIIHTAVARGEQLRKEIWDVALQQRMRGEIVINEIRRVLGEYQ